MMIESIRFVQPNLALLVGQDLSEVLQQEEWNQDFDHL